MSLKPIAPMNRRSARGVRPAPMPVVIVPKKQSNGSNWVLILLLAALLGGGYVVYNNQQKNEAAIAARDARDAENRRKADEVRQRMADEQATLNSSSNPAVTALGTAVTEEPETTPITSSTSSVAESFETEVTTTPAQSEGESSALGSTSVPVGGTGEYAVTDTSAPRFDLKAEGNKARQVSKKLREAIDEASRNGTFHDLQADLKRAFDVAYPGLFTSEASIPPYPDKEQKTLRLAQGIYVCLNIASELEARDEVDEKKHARFVNWLLADKAKAARTFTYGLEHYEVNDLGTAADIMSKLREAYLKDPAGAQKKIPTILKKAS